LVECHWQPRDKFKVGGISELQSVAAVTHYERLTIVGKPPTFTAIFELADKLQIFFSVNSGYTFAPTQQIKLIVE